MKWLGKIQMAATRISRRSLAFLVLVPLTLVTALLVLQYKSLRKLEQATAVAHKEKLKGYLDSVTREVEQFYRSRAAIVLAVTPGQLRGDDALIRQHLHSVCIPGARLFFTRSFGDGGQTRFFTPKGASHAPTTAEAHAVTLATASWEILATEGAIVPRSNVTADEHDTANRIIAAPVLDPARRVVGVTGIVLDDQKAIRNVVRPILQKEMLSRFDQGLDGTDIVVTIRNPEGRSVFETGEIRREAQLMTAAVPFIFTDWKFGIEDTCATPEQLAACNFRINALWSGSVALLLLGSIGLTLRTATREARLSQMKSDFVSNVSHELRTPLSSIRVFGEYMSLGRVKDPEKIQEYGSFIERESRRLTQLINNILDFSKIESAEKKYEFREVSLFEVAQRAVSTVRNPANDDAVKIALKSEGSLPLVIGDAGALEQVVLNLLDNAVKYSPGNGEIEVTLSSSEDEARLAVRDRGIGIDRDEQKRIFEKFYRVGSTLIHDIKGTGLGLTIVNHIVAAHGGRVTVISSPGDGSTFTIHLPVASAADGSTESNLAGVRA